MSLNPFPVTDLWPEVELMHLLYCACAGIVMFETDAIEQTSSLEWCLVYRCYVIMFLLWNIMLCNGISRLWMVCGGGVLLTNVRWYSSCPSLLVVITARTMLNHTCRICYKPGLNVTLVHHLSFRGNCWALSHKLHFSGIIISVC